MAEPLTSQVWVAAWLQKAGHDIETAERALHAGSPITDTAAYHCHQAAEKALKAFLASRLKPLVKTHDLMDLLTRCALPIGPTASPSSPLSALCCDIHR